MESKTVRRSNGKRVWSCTPEISAFWRCSRRVASLGYVQKPVSKKQSKDNNGEFSEKADFMSPHGLWWTAACRSPSKQKDLKYSGFRHQCLCIDVIKHPKLGVGR